MTTATVSVGKLYREKLVKNIKTELSQNTSTFVLSYTNVSASKFGAFRKNLKKVGAKVHVSKNKIARIALKDAKFTDLADKTEGQTAFVWSNDSCVEISKTLVKFTEECKGVVVFGGLVEGRLLETKDVKRLSELPSREELLAKLLSLLQAPISRLLGALTAKPRDLLSILNQLKEKKEKGGN